MFKIICYEKSTVQNHTHKLAYPHPLGWLLFFKKEKTPSDTKDREKIVTLMHSWWECKTAWMQYKIVWCPPQIKYRTTAWPSNLAYSKELKAKSWRAICTPCSQQHHSQQKQRQCPPTDEWTNKNMLNTYSGTWFHPRKEVNSDICLNMDEPRGYHTWQTKPLIKR